MGNGVKTSQDGPGETTVGIVRIDKIQKVGPGIFIVNDSQIARFRLIRTGRRFDDVVEIITGLDEGQRFVRTPSPILVDGARVEAIP